MVGYENLLSIVYCSGPPLFGAQCLRVKTIDMSNRNYKILYDVEFPLSRMSNLTWTGYSEEGQLFSFDNEGVLRCLNPINYQWVPILDFKIKCPNTFE